MPPIKTKREQQQQQQKMDTQKYEQAISEENTNSLKTYEIIATNFSSSRRQN